MAKIKLKHYRVLKGKHGYWIPTPKMKAAGFEIVRCGHDGPAAWALAKEWEDRWQAYRRGHAPAVAVARQYPRNSVGDAFERFRRTESWADKAARTREDWERGWSYIEPYFGDRPPSAISFEILDDWYHRLLKKRGVDIAFRAMKTWRALYGVMAAMQLVVAKQDPSTGIRRRTPVPRNQIWSEGEVVRLVKGAWRAGFKGLACIAAVAWDTGFAPVDVRKLTPSHKFEVGGDWGFSIDRSKTGVAALGTLTRRTQRLVLTYIEDLGVTLLDDAPIFRSRGHRPGPKGGRPRAGVPYSKGALVDDFADVRRLIFGEDEKRRLMDMRRSGATEANAGGVEASALAAKMANSIDTNKTLQKTYLPTTLATVRKADKARVDGRRLLAAERNQHKKLKQSGEKS